MATKTDPYVQVVRRRANYALYQLAIKPLTDLYGTEHDGWKGWGLPEHNIHEGYTNPNPVWFAAIELVDRRVAAYYALVPAKDWPTQ